MGLTYANIKLSNPKRPHLKEMEVKVLVDTGAIWCKSNRRYGLIVHPLKNKLMVNPESPNIPSGILK